MAHSSVAGDANSRYETARCLRLENGRCQEALYLRVM